MNSLTFLIVPFSNLADNRHSVSVIQFADACLSAPLLSVTDKEKTPPSGDKRDWMNLADYTWPNPDTPDGLPYISRDGEANPEASLYDRRRFNRFVLSVIRLGAAWEITRQPRYAEKAIDLLKHWFIDPITGMNPNLNYCHHVPGDVPGRKDGLIVFCSALPSVLDVWQLLRCNGLIADEDAALMRQWASELLHWLQTNPMSIDHAQGENNQGAFHDLLEIYLMIFVGQKDAGNDAVAKSLSHRPSTQILPSGEMPLETHRTLSAQYSLYNLKALYCLAHIAQSLGIDGWHRDAERPEILRATDYLYRYAVGEAKWKFQQIEPPNWWYLAPLCAVANRAYGQHFDLTRIPMETAPRAVPAELVIFIPGWELIFAPTHQQHLPQS